MLGATHTFISPPQKPLRTGGFFKFKIEHMAKYAIVDIEILNKELSWTRHFRGKYDYERDKVKRTIKRARLSDDDTELTLKDIFVKGVLAGYESKLDVNSPKFNRGVNRQWEAIRKTL